MEKVPQFESAEKKYLLEPESGYFNALHFVQDPVDYLIGLRIELSEEEYDPVDLVIEAIGEIEELRDIIQNEQIAVEDERIQQIRAATYGTYTWALPVFALLKEAQFTKQEIADWIVMHDPELSSEERLQERMLHRALIEVFQE